MMADTKLEWPLPKNLDAERTTTLRRYLKTYTWLREFVLACPDSIPKDWQAKLRARIQVLERELAKREINE